MNELSRQGMHLKIKQLMKENESLKNENKQLKSKFNSNTATQTDMISTSDTATETHNISTSDTYTQTDTTSTYDTLTHSPIILQPPSRDTSEKNKKAAKKQKDRLVIKMNFQKKKETRVDKIELLKKLKTKECFVKMIKMKPEKPIVKKINKFEIFCLAKSHKTEKKKKISKQKKDVVVVNNFKQYTNNLKEFKIPKKDNTKVQSVEVFEKECLVSENKCKTREKESLPKESQIIMSRDKESADSSVSEKKDESAVSTGNLIDSSVSAAIVNNCEESDKESAESLEKSSHSDNTVHKMKVSPVTNHDIMVLIKKGRMEFENSTKI